MNARAFSAVICALLVANSILAQTSENDERLKSALKKYPQADTNNDGVLTAKEALAFRKKMQGNRGGNEKQKQTSYPVKPTFADVKYGEFDRNTLDFWQAETEKPAPLLVYIHGGGFRGGSKERIAHRGVIEKALDSGMHCASINYRYRYNSEADHSDPQKTTLAGCFLDGARAIQFMKYKASEWKIDKDKIIVFGSSAGGGISLFIGFYDDLADPKSEDIVLRESSRVFGIGHMSSQPTYNIGKWEEILGYAPEDIQKVVSQAKAGVPQHVKLGFRSEEGLKTEEGKKYLSMIDMTEHADSEDPPVFIFNPGKNEKPTHHGQVVHHPRLSIYLDEVCKKNGIDSKLVLNNGTRVNGYDELFKWCTEKLAE